jgi:transposase InsO family protein
VSKARLVITAVVLEGRSQSEVARTYGVSQSWISRLVARYRAEGDAAFEPRSRRPRTSPAATSPEVIARIVELRAELIARGLDAGAQTISWHLAEHDQVTISPATVHRILVREGRVIPQPKKRPRSSYVRFEAELPNECWQADVTHWTLADGSDVEILTFLDDHSRMVIHISAHRPVRGRTVVDAFRQATRTHGIPASTLTDNGMIFTTRYSGGKGGRNGFEAELRRLGVRQKNSRPNHPTTCGKVERFHQTLKRWLAAQRSPATLRTLQRQLDRFVDDYNTRRPHTSLRPARPPVDAFHARPKAAPDGRDDHHTRVRHDRVGPGGKVTLRLDGQLYSIGLGRTHERTRVVMLVQDLDVRIIDAATGELLRQLTINPAKRYQTTGRPPGPQPRQTH